MNKYFYIVFVWSFLSGSCEEVIDLKLDTQEKQLVIDAYIDWYKGEEIAIPVVHLSYTNDYYSTQKSEAVSGAKITITTCDNDSYVLEEIQKSSLSANGLKLPSVIDSHQGGSIYICKEKFVPKLGKDYILTIDYKGDRYTSKARMYEVPNMDSSGIVQKNDGGLFKDKIEVRFYFKGIENERNSYLVQLENADDAVVFGFDDTFVSNGNFFFSTSPLESVLEKGNIIKAKLFRISSDYKHFIDFLKLSKGANSRGKIGVIPTRVFGNIIHEKDATKNPLGAFRVSQYVEIEYVIE